MRGILADVTKQHRQMQTKRGREALVALGALVLTGEKKAPTEFRIFAYGVNTSDKGDFTFDEKAAASVMAAFAKKGSALTMDYEHQALNAAENGKPAPNSCRAWTPTIRYNDAGQPELWATNVVWTPTAAAYIENGEYVHFSPAFEIDPKTLRIERVINMALTNIPALDNQRPLLAASVRGATTQGDDMKAMKCKACLRALKAPTDDDDGDEMMCVACGGFAKVNALVGLKADATEVVLLGAVGEAVNFRGTICTMLSVKSPAEAVGKILALQAKEAEVATLSATIEAERGARLQAAFDAILDEAGKAGKIEPAAREGIVKPILALSGGKVTQQAIDALQACTAAIAPKVITPGGENKPDDKGKGAGSDRGPGGSVRTMGEADFKIAKLTGIGAKQIEEHLKAVGAGTFGKMATPGKGLLLE